MAEIISKEEKRTKLIELRRETGMNRREFAEYLGIPYRTLQDWELGNREVTEYLLRFMTYYVMTQKEQADGCGASEGETQAQE